MKSILFLVGSLRAESMNRRVSMVAERMLPEGYVATRFDLADVPFLNQDDKGERTPPSVLGLRAAITEADGVFWTSPEYNFGMPGIVKNAVDLASRPMVPRSSIVATPMNAVVATESSHYGSRALADLKRIWANCGGVAVGYDFVLQQAPSKFLLVDEVESLEPISRQRLQLTIDHLVRTIESDAGALALANWQADIDSKLA